MADVPYSVGAVALCIYENYRLIGFVPCEKKSEKQLAQSKTGPFFGGCFFFFLKPWLFSELLRIRDKVIHTKGLASYLASKCTINIGCYSVVILATKLFSDWY